MVSSLTGFLPLVLFHLSAAAFFPPPNFQELKISVASCNKPTNGNWIYNQISDAWYATSSTYYDYESANQYCILLASGVNLADIQDSNEMSFVIENFSGSNYWVSGQATPDHNSWYASSYSSTYKMSYLPWFSGYSGIPNQPDNSQGQERCIQLSLNEDFYGIKAQPDSCYNDLSCTSTNQPICKYKC